jgi:uncharacterized protein YceH (UPF0502 family)
MQLFSGDNVARAPSPADSAHTSSRSSDDDRLTHLENEVLELRREVSEMQQQLSTFRKQFE